MRKHRSNRFFPAEWENQAMVQLAWPDDSTDWADSLNEVLPCYANLCHEISSRQKLLIIANDKSHVLPWIRDAVSENITIVEIPLNDTWARDHGFLTVFEGDIPILLDFKFNGWGLKFAADKDNLISRRLYQTGYFHAGVIYENHLNIVLEGGSIESDGEGTLLTTSRCLLSPNRNGSWTERQIESCLKEILGAKKMLWLNSGFLEGDDTDSHIDTLARFAPGNRIFYVKCEHRTDIHYKALFDMEAELRQVTSASGEPYRLVPLPMCSPVVHEGTRLPATYANFLFVNSAVLVPVYGIEEDKIALDLFEKEFPEYEIVGINCRPLIKQHGSLHCVTMQYPAGVL